MKKRVGILTSGGDCPGLNATLRGVAKALYQRMWRLWASPTATTDSSTGTGG